MSDKDKLHYGYKQRHTRYVYLMESEDYLKIGISFDPYHRLERVNNHNKDSGQRFKIVKYVDCLDGVASRLMESQLHEKYRDYQIITDLEGAKTECFSKVIKHDVISDLDNSDIYQYFDPFICCHPKHYRNFLSNNNLNVEDICNIIGRKFSDYVHSAIKKSMSCILANISVGKGKRIVYVKRDIENLASGRTFCYLILNKMFNQDGYLNADNFVLENLDVKYDVLTSKAFNTVYFREQARPLMFLNLYSYKNNISEYLTRRIDQDSVLSKARVVPVDNEVHPVEKVVTVFEPV